MVQIGEDRSERLDRLTSTGRCQGVLGYLPISKAILSKDRIQGPGTPLTAEPASARDKMADCLQHWRETLEGPYPPRSTAATTKYAISSSGR